MATYVPFIHDAFYGFMARCCPVFFPVYGVFFGFIHGGAIDVNGSDTYYDLVCFQYCRLGCLCMNRLLYYPCATYAVYAATEEERVRNVELERI